MPTCAAAQAVEAYEGAVRVDENHLGSALALARLHLEQGQFEKGRAVCEQLVKIHPASLDAQLLQAQLLLAQARMTVASTSMNDCS